MSKDALNRLVVSWGLAPCSRTHSPLLLSPLWLSKLTSPPCCLFALDAKSAKSRKHLGLIKSSSNHNRITHTSFHCLDGAWYFITTSRRSRRCRTRAWEAGGTQAPNLRPNSLKEGEDGAYTKAHE
ncbi:hypothetical protein CR513_18858, partial [Mucuna pruriens]